MSSPLHKAAGEGNVETVISLLNDENLNSKNIDNLTPLHYASRRGQVEIIRILVDRGADVSTCNWWGETTLHEASDCGQIEIIRILLEKGADVNVRDGKGRTPLHNACDSGQIETIRILLDNGADVNLCDEKGRTPLHDASNNDQYVTIRILVDNRADVNVCDEKGRTPLHDACRMAEVETIVTLLDLGADANVCDTKGRSPLHYACETPRVGIVRILLDEGTDVNVRDAHGSTPLHDACRTGQVETVRNLLYKGADANISDGRGWTPLHWAYERAQGRIATYDELADFNTGYYRAYLLKEERIGNETLGLLLEWGVGADVWCTEHKSCKCSIVQCMYTDAWNKRNGPVPNGATWKCFDKYVIAATVARLYTGIKNVCTELHEVPNSGNAYSQDEHRVQCETELSIMKTEEILGTHSTCMDVLRQRLHALRSVDPSSLEYYRHKFSIYGEIMWRRYVPGRKRLLLIEESTGFFSLTRLPRLPPECALEIFNYLPDIDLKHLASVCKRCVSSRDEDRLET